MFGSPFSIDFPSVYYASVSRDKKYLAVSTFEGTYLYSDPFTTRQLVQVAKSSLYHIFSKDGNYFIISTKLENSITIYIHANSTISSCFNCSE